MFYGRVPSNGYSSRIILSGNCWKLNLGLCVCYGHIIKVILCNKSIQAGWFIFASLNEITVGSCNVCRLIGTKPLLGHMMTYCQQYTWEQTLMRFEPKHKHFHPRKWIWKCLQQNIGFFCLGHNMSMYTISCLYFVFPILPSNRKCQDYVYIKWEYWSTMYKIKHN